jgi:hypothetical protein
MKKITIIIFCLALALSAYAFPKKQDKNNIAYIDEIDMNIDDTIELIGIFNDIANNMSNSVKGANEFSQYLMGLTLECSSMRKIISESIDLDDLEREWTIRIIWDFLKPHDIELISPISAKADKQNRIVLNELYTIYQDKINHLRKGILDEEKIIKKNNTITTRYLALHNSHFMYHLILGFIENHHYLSRSNRQYLINLIDAVEEAIIES